MGTRWNALLQSLVLVRLGQELGSDTQLARSIASAIDLLVSITAKFFV
jgi:hypothetical protein